MGSFIGRATPCEMTSVFGGPAASRKPATYRTSIHFIRGISTLNHQELEPGRVLA